MVTWLQVEVDAPFHELFVEIFSVESKKAPFIMFLRTSFCDSHGEVLND